ncbi:MAG: single-stranded-DNA-specific exonuclease RecJ [Caldithrix sp.]|nr:single-stranded-DNA-specific exonuclease RecJ [Caldithrix sp.]
MAHTYFKSKSQTKLHRNSMLPRKRWKIINSDTNLSIVDVILKNRLLPVDHMDSFKLTDRMHSPYLLQDMDKAVKRIIKAIDNNERIAVFGDYDVDGITSTALMVYFFRKVNYPVQYRLPNREKDGYGLRTESVKLLHKEGIDLIITVDNGITSNEAVDYAAQLGVDVVVTDHHLQEAELPNAQAVVNPNRVDSKYPFKNICGAAVAFKLIYALSEQLMDVDEYKHFLLNHLDLVTLGTIADVMPLVDENYAMVKFGLKVLSKTRKPGLMALKKISGVKTATITPITVGYFLAPRLNASGRMEEADHALELLTAESHERATEMARYLDSLNKKRQMLQADYVDYAMEQLPTNRNHIDKVIFVENDDWHAGLIGLISGKLKERFYRPAFAFTKDEDGNFVGSARSIDAFHVTNALTEFSHYFINYGGHHKAAGLTIAQQNYDKFREEFTYYVNEHINDDDLVPELVIDSIVDIDQINLNTARMLQEVGPFGEANEEPVLMMDNGRIHEIIELSGGRHLKLYIQKGNQMFECLWWNSGEHKNLIHFGDQIDLAFKLNINMWQGTERLQLTIEDIKDHN